MILSITKSARQFGYVIWSAKTEGKLKALIGNRDKVSVVFNGLFIGVKVVDWKYHRISVGYKFTRALPETATVYKLGFRNEKLEVEATNA